MRVIGCRAGRKWTVDGLAADASYTGEGPISSATEEYIIEREANDVAWTRADVNVWNFQNITGLPKIGDAHNGTSGSMLRVTSISFAEGSGGDKMFVVATVTYSRVANSIDPAAGSDPEFYCESWGWSNGSVQRDLTAADGEPIVNSAGDPYDSVPQIDVPSPTFHKTFKTKTRYAGILGYHNKVNNWKLTISGVEFQAGQLRVVQASEERIFDAGPFRYRYTVGLQMLSNVMKKVYVLETTTTTTNGQTTTTTEWKQKTNHECGWNMVVADMGLRERAQGDTEAKRITETAENGDVGTVTLPVALNGFGLRASDGKPVLRMYQTYAPVAIPAIFYSEPA